MNEPRATTGAGVTDREAQHQPGVLHLPHCVPALGLVVLVFNGLWAWMIDRALDRDAPFAEADVALLPCR